VPRQIVRHLAAAGGMADVNGVAPVEIGGQRGGGVGIVPGVTTNGDGARGFRVPVTAAGAFCAPGNRVALS